MKKVEFVHIKQHDFKALKPLSDQYLLLSYFIEDYRYRTSLNETISKLESIRSGQKTFDQAQQPNVLWSFGNASGYFECDKDTAYLEPLDADSEFQRVVLPLQEVIDLFKEWKRFLENN